VVQAALREPGRALDAPMRNRFEAALGVDLGEVRLHRGSRADSAAEAVSARAFTVGSDIVVASDESLAGTGGLRLLAHELAHVVQHRAGRGLHTLHRQPTSTAAPSRGDSRLADPSFLVCLVLCYLGIPPGLWRTVVNQVLQAVSEEYKTRYGEQRGSAEFESWRAELTLWSAFNILKFVLVFLGEGKIGPISLTNASALAIRQRLLEWLAVRGVETAAVEAASQIIRKVAIFIELAWVAGCGAYCGATAVANALLEFGQSAISAISSFVSVLSQAGAAFGRAIARPILIARITMDPSNWDVSSLPTRSAADMNAIGLAFRLAFTPDSFLTYMARTLSSFNIANILEELAQDINSTLQRRGGFIAVVTFTPEFIGGLTPIQLVNILRDYGLLRFIASPEQLADQQLNAPPATP
jgi:hypothetical protein